MAASKTTSKKILICDDEEGVRESLKVILENEYDLIITTSGEQCLECLKNSADVALVFLDIKMPLMGGIEALTEIKKNYPKLPVVMISGYRSSETAGEMTRLGARDYVVKPFHSTDILESIKRNLG